MIILTKKQVIQLHSQLIETSGGSDGLRDVKLLESALSEPFQTFDGIDLHPGLKQKAAKLALGLVQNHPFVDGNKRIGAHVMLVFLEINGVAIEYAQKELVDLFLSIAHGEVNQADILKWIIKHEI